MSMGLDVSDEEIQVVVIPPSNFLLDEMKW